MPTFALAKRNGALDEWLSLRSAKPSTAVRIRQAPPSKTTNPATFTNAAGFLFCNTPPPTAKYWLTYLQKKANLSVQNG